MSANNEASGVFPLVIAVFFEYLPLPSLLSILRTFHISMAYLVASVVESQLLSLSPRPSYLNPISLSLAYIYSLLPVQDHTLYHHNPTYHKILVNMTPPKSD